jgi:hypothetical protein
MHVHLPKPLHGWRPFAGEVGIIVVGVLIALAAQQVVETIHQRDDVEQLVAALRSELGDDRARWEHIRASDACTLQRLDALDRWLATAPAGAKLDRPYRLFLWNMHSSAWDLAKTSPAAHIPLRQRLTYASLYGAIDNWRQFINEENANAAMLSGLLATAGQPENRRQVPFHIAQARFLVNRRQLNYDYFFTRFDALGIKADESQLTVRPNDRRLCEPLTS